MKRDPTILKARAIVERAPKPRVETVFDECTSTASHIVYDESGGKAAIIDSVLDFDPISGRTSDLSIEKLLQIVDANKLSVEWHLETHIHADHLSAGFQLRGAIGGKIAIGSHIGAVKDQFRCLLNDEPESYSSGRSDIPNFDHLMADGDEFTIGKLNAIAIHVPGHTSADIAYVIGDAVFVGDTMFMPDLGSARTDFPGGDARQLYSSVRRLLQLPELTRVFLCHDYKSEGREKFCWESSIHEQRTRNIHFAHVSEDAFVSMREKRDRSLSLPRLIIPALQVNLRAGRMPNPDSNGISYMKIPVNHDLFSKERTKNDE